MPRVHVKGWQSGFRKVSTTEVFRARLGIGLNEAKSLTDAILDGRAVRLEVATAEAAHTLATALRELGADATAQPEA